VEGEMNKFLFIHFHRNEGRWPRSGHTARSDETRDETFLGYGPKWNGTRDDGCVATIRPEIESPLIVMQIIKNVTHKNGEGGVLAEAPLVDRWL